MTDSFLLLHSVAIPRGFFRIYVGIQGDSSRFFTHHPSAIFLPYQGSFFVCLISQS